MRETPDRAKPPEGVRRPLRRLLAFERSVAETLCAPPRLYVAAGFFVYGLLLLLGSLVVGVASTCGESETICTGGTDLVPIGQERGFLFAPNWSLTAVLIWPAMYLVLATILSQASAAFRSMDDSPMAWLRKAGEKGSIFATWRAQMTWLLRIVLTAAIAALLVSIAEWWKSSGSILIDHEALTREAERDWAIALRGASRGDEIRLAGLSFLAFVYQSLVIVMLCGFAAASALMARTIALHSAGRADPVLIADASSNDPSSRLGFERFVVLIDYMILFVLLAYSNFFLTRIQNAYLRDTAAENLLAFVRSDFAFNPATQPIAELFQTRAWDFSSAAVSAGAIIILFFSFFFFNASLRHAAIRARNRADQAYAEPALLERMSRYGLDLEKIQTRLHSANVWPMGYSDVLPTLALLVVSMISIIYYRVGVVLVFGWLAGWILSRITAGLLRRV